MMVNDSTVRITGRVQWGVFPVPGAGIELKDRGDYYRLPVLAASTAQADGRFVLEYPFGGEFMVCAIAPSLDYWNWTCQSLKVGAGQMLDVGTLELSKKIVIVGPAGYTEVNTRTPVLQWAIFPGAAFYEVTVWDLLTHEAIMRQETTDTRMVVAPPLAARGNYQWSAVAFDAAKNRIAYDHAWFFTAPA